MDNGLICDYGVKLQKMGRNPDQWTKKCFKKSAFCHNFARDLQCLAACCTLVAELSLALRKLIHLWSTSS